MSFDAELWIWESRQADTWVFVSVPATISEEIRDLASGRLRRGFGSLRVWATIGGSRWVTSIFPDTPPQLLPVGNQDRRPHGRGTGSW